MSTQSNTISFGAPSATPAVDVKAKQIETETSTINKLFEIHRTQTVNDLNSYKGYGEGLRAFMKAIDLILKINQDWAYELLWKYYEDNKNGSCLEEKCFKGAVVVKDDLNTYAAINSLLRHYTMGYSSNVTERAYVNMTGSADLVLWVEKKAGI